MNEYTEEDALLHLDLKEKFASVIFDYEWEPEEDRPSERTCHAIGAKIADLVMELLSDQIA